MSDRIKKYPHPEEAAQRLSRGTHSADPAARQSFRSLGGCVMSGPIAGRNDSCPCGSGRKFKKCCGAAHPAPASASPPRGARPVRLNFGPLSEAGELREAAEALRQSMHGVPTARLNAGNAAGARRAPPAQRQTGAAQRFRRQGVGLLRAGKLPAAVTALRQATRLDPADAGSHRALGLALLRSAR